MTVGKTAGISVNAAKIIAKRYSIKDKKGKPTEEWTDVVERVVNHVAQAEIKPKDFIFNMTDIMERRVFLPNTPCLVNAGKPNAQLAGCFVLPVPDSILGIMETAKNTALVHQSGGGTGFTFEGLRPAGSLVKTTHGVASGPVSFMEIFDKVTDVIKQGGVRRGANMGIMRCDHPDILRFVHAKNNQDKLTNFNISVSVTDEFMKAVEEGEWIQTKFNGKPWTQAIYDPTTNDDYLYVQGGMRWRGEPGQIYAPDIWNRIIESAHKYAEPGVIFIDTVNRHNHLKSLGDIKATNPCAEQALHENNSCNLGSIDVSRLFNPNWNGAYFRTGKDVPEGNFDWEEFRRTIYWCVRFLDNVIDTCTWPLPEINEMVQRTRPVGLGIMGFADLLLKLKTRYGSDESIVFLHTLMDFFQKEAWRASCKIGKEKGAFPEFENNKEEYTRFLWSLGLNSIALDYDDLLPADDFQPRNYEVTTIAPTGTISLVAETSSGIEPNFAWEFIRQDTVGTRKYTHPLAVSFVDACQPLPDYFVTAHDVTPEEHVKILAAAQAHVDNGVSKTCNAPIEATVESVDTLHRMAYKLGVKAVSYYRDGSREGQVLTKSGTEVVSCPECTAELQITDGCETCLECGFGKCAIS
jgi:ribonucleoside-diphosphate reductase alpha chain